jgi:pimeloyl-ACP methyl ester carboxylesterase
MQSILKQENGAFWQWDLPSGSHQIYYIEKGIGPHHLLLLHGFAAHSFTWRWIMDDLVKAGYHVWAIDLIGSGRSDKPIEVPYGLDLFTHQIEAFMRAKNMTRACVIGHSMGGGLALALSLLYPHPIQSLVLIDALAFPLKLPLYFAITRALGKWVKPLIGKSMVKQILHQILYDPNNISEEQIQAYDFPFHMSGGKEAFIKTLQNYNDQELERLALHFKELKVPILIIWGERDPWMPLSYFQRLSSLFPQAQTVVISHCGHVPQEEHPQKVSQAIVKFLT